MIEPLCLWCEHFGIEMAEEGYSEYTPGSDFSIWCRKNEWSFDAFTSSASEFRKCIVAAKTCEFYQFNEQLVQEAM